MLEEGNGRLTLCFAAFEGAPRILRLYGHAVFLLEAQLRTGLGTGRRQTVTDTELERVRKAFDGELPGQENCDPGFRSIFVLRVERATHSCGYSVPLFQYQAERTTLKDFAGGKGRDGMIEYQGYKNSFSIDGLPSVGQLIQQRWPSSMTFKDGYFFATYDDDDLTSTNACMRVLLGGYRKVSTWLKSRVIYGSLYGASVFLNWRTLQSVMQICGGFAAGLCYARSVGMWRRPTLSC